MGILLALLLYFGPVVLIGWGWERWMSWPGRLSRSSALGFAGFALATASWLLEVGSGAYAIVIGGFSYYDPRLMRIFSIGILISMLGLVLAIAGGWNRNPIRWHAMATSFAMLVSWFLFASME
jgi:hypothetical protein